MALLKQFKIHKGSGGTAGYASRFTAEGLQVTNAASARFLHNSTQASMGIQPPVAPPVFVLLREGSGFILREVGDKIFKEVQ